MNPAIWIVAIVVYLAIGLIASMMYVLHLGKK